MNREGEGRGEQEQEALAAAAGRVLKGANVERARIAASMEGLGADGREKYERYLSEVDPRLLELVANPEVFYQLESVLDRLEWEMSEELSGSEAKRAFEGVVGSAREFGRDFADLKPRTNPVFFRHIISEVRSLLLISRAQTGEDPAPRASRRILELLGHDKASFKIEKEGPVYRGKKLNKTAKWVLQGVDSRIAVRRAVVELEREERVRAASLRKKYEDIIQKIIGAKDGKLPV